MPVATTAALTDKLVLPDNLVGEIRRNVEEKSVIASLATATPQIFGNQEYMVFTMEPEAEYVGEGAEKHSADWAFEPIQGKPHKVQVTIRMSEEVTWADEDNQLGILNALFDAMGGAFGRALDYGMIHGISPLQKAVLETLKPDALALVGNQVTSTGNAEEDIDSLPDLVLANDYNVTGVALDRMYANELRKIRNPNTGAKVYPEINLNLDPGTLEGLKAVTSGAVSGKRLAPAPTGVKAIMGDWSLINWGVVRDFGIEEIRYGDPDGLGDLKRYNQVAFRAETVFSWVNFDPKGFSVLREAAAKTASK